MINATFQTSHVFFYNILQQITSNMKSFFIDSLKIKKKRLAFYDKVELIENYSF